MWVAIIATVVVGAVLFKLFFSNSNDIFKQYGIRYIDTSHVAGKLDLMLGRKLTTAADDYAYCQMGSNEKFCGIWDMATPVVIVKDMGLIKKILIKDSLEHFVDRREPFSDQDGCLKHFLFSLEGDQWKGVRAAVSPTFTTGKIRKMMQIFNSVGQEWVQEYTRKAALSPNGSITIDVLKAVNLYTVEVISSTAFGMSAGAIKDPNSTFMKMATRLSDVTTTQILKFAFKFTFPTLSNFLRLQTFDMEALSYFERILEQGVTLRMKGQNKRNDFLQLLVEAKRGELKAADEDGLTAFEKDAQISEDVTSKKQYLTDEIMIAQSVEFFFAGFSTTSNLLSFVLYALALHPDIQEKLRQEVDRIVKEDGSLDYDDVGQLVYMDMVVCEALRKFPALTRLERKCVKKYSDPESGLVLPKEAVVGIPVDSIHNDKLYYDNPEKFDPEHFSPEKKAARNPYAFMPFGIGPRSCVGMRFALIGAKSAIAHMVHGFTVEPIATTPVPLQGKPAGPSQMPPSNLELKLTPKRKQ